MKKKSKPAEAAKSEKAIPPTTKAAEAASEPTPFEIAQIAAVLSLRHPRRQQADWNDGQRWAVSDNQGEPVSHLYPPFYYSNLALKFWYAAQKQVQNPAEAQVSRLVEGVYDMPEGEWEDLYEGFTDHPVYLRQFLNREKVLQQLFRAKSETTVSRRKKFDELLMYVSKDKRLARRLAELTMPLPQNSESVNWFVNDGHAFPLVITRVFALARQQQLREAKNRGKKSGKAENTKKK